MTTHDIALICENGHIVNSASTNKPEFNTEYCKECGAKTISQCENEKCKAPIQGAEVTFRDLGRTRRKIIIPSSLPKYCHQCGMPYPWMERTIQVALEYADMLDDLSDSEKVALKIAIPDLVKDTPQSKVAILQFQKLAPKIGKAGMNGFKEILVGIVSEVIVKKLFP